MSTLADRTIAALRANHDDLAGRVRGFSGADLDRPSGSAEWDVAQVLSHLGSASEIGLASLRNAVAGAPRPDQSFNEAVWDRWNAMGQREKADGYLRSAESLVAAYEDLDATARQDLRIDLGFLPEPADVTLITGMRLNEAAQHSWDVRVAFDPSATLLETDVAALLEHLRGPLGFLLRFIGRPDGLDGATARLCVDTSAPDESFGLLIEEAVSLSEAPAEADGVVTGAAESFIRLVGGRLGPDHTPAGFAVSGGTVTLDQLRRVFVGT